jgi:hypothetical protein
VINRTIVIVKWKWNSTDICTKEVSVSISSFFTLLLLWGSYSLGRFNAQRPGETWELVKRCAAYMVRVWNGQSRETD